ncbi:MAG: hypothetical protein HYS55_01790 [Candidatus Omnitrophica bacterium]|nr:hypothetical protein [Candidatus Omnitrophota bacterium]
MAGLTKSFKDKLAWLLREEEVDLYVLTMHYLNDGELAFFEGTDRSRVKHIFDILIQDTKEHARILKSLLGSGGK